MRRAFAALAAVVALVLAGCNSSHSPSSKPTDLNDSNGCQTYCGFEQDPPQPRPSFTLTDTQGKPFSFGSVTAGHPTLLYFGYTKCPDICPTTMADIGEALHAMPTSLQDKTYVVFVTTDVKRDTGAVMQQWLSNFHTSGTFLNKATWVGLRGTQDQIYAAEAASKITLSEDEGQTHSAEVLLFSPDDYSHVAFNASSTEQQELTHDLPIAAKQG